MDFADGKIKGYVGPKDLGAADDVERVIVDFIAQTTATLDVAVQELDSVPIAEALIAQKLAGRSIRVILNHTYLQDAKAPAGLTTVAELAIDEGGHKINRDVFAALCRVGIEVRIDLNPVQIWHQKFIVRDVRLDRDDDPRAGKNPGLLTGSANFTDTDCHTNLNHVLVFRDTGVEVDFTIEFAEAWGGQFGRATIGYPPRTHSLGGVPVEVLFSPDHGPEAEVVKQLLKCPKGENIDCAMFTFAGSSAIDDAMITLAGADREIRVVLDPGQSAAQHKWPAARWLQQADVEVLVPKKQQGFRKLHHKLLVVGSSTVVAGSFNYSEPATLLNDEALLVLGSPYYENEGKKVDKQECEHIASFFRTEIERIAANSDPWTDQP